MYERGGGGGFDVSAAVAEGFETLEDSTFVYVRVGALHGCFWRGDRMVGSLKCIGNGILRVVITSVMPALGGRDSLLWGSSCRRGHKEGKERIYV